MSRVSDPRSHRPRVICAVPGVRFNSIRPDAEPEEGCLALMP